MYARINVVLVLSLLAACAPVEDSDAPVDAAGPTFTVVAEPADIPDVTPLADGAGVLYLANGGSSVCLVEDGTVTCDDGVLQSATGVDISADGASAAIAGSGDPGALILVAIVVYPVCRAIGVCGPDSVLGAPTVLDNTSSFYPDAVDIEHVGGVESVYFSGVDPESGTGGVFSVPLAGGDVTTVATGFADVPSGVAVATDGTVYAAEGDALYELVDGVATVIADGITLGEPAGLALTPDDGSVMVSSLLDGHSAVTLVARQDHAVSFVTDTIDANTGSGGLHRAASEASVYAWCGNPSGKTGTIYYIEF